MKFVADTMLGKLARWLRILGYDTIYDASFPFQKLVEMSNSGDVVFLTRRKYLPSGNEFSNAFYIPVEKFDDQLRFVVETFKLDIHQNLFTRCLRCNIEVRVVEKSKLKGKIPKQSFEGFDIFSECPNCHNVYWNGAHFTNTLKKLNRIFNN